LLAPLPGLVVEISPVAEGPAGKEIPFHIIKGPLDSGLGLNRQLLPFARVKLKLSKSPILSILSAESPTFL
jgi:hypothetical protein